MPQSNVRRNEILCSRQYEMFKPSNINRGSGNTLSYREDWVLKLKASMAVRGFIPSYPIIVRSDFTIVSGHHRFEAAKRLGIAVYYIVDDTLETTDIVEIDRIGNPKWTPMDVLQSYARNGSAHYVKFRTILKETGLGFGNLCLLIMDKEASAWRYEFDKGFMVITPEKEQYVRHVAACLKDFKSVVPTCMTSKGFMPALRFVMNSPHYDHTRMQRQLKHPIAQELGQVATLYAWVNKLNEVYNDKCKNRVNFNPKNLSSRSFEGRKSHMIDEEGE